MPKVRNVDKIITEIARYKAEYYQDKDIIGFLQIPESTYYYYIKKHRGQIDAVLKERDGGFVEAEIARCKNAGLRNIRQLEDIIDGEADAKSKIDAIKAKWQIQIDLVKIEHEGPQVVGEHGNNNRQTSIEYKEEATPASS